MEFEFNPRKSASNIRKHGIDFVEAQTEDKPRFLVVSRIGEKHWSSIITYRGEQIRIISVRRSRREEIEIYDS